MAACDVGSRKVPQVSILDRSTVERIHVLALDILERTGILIHYPPARELLRSHGARLGQDGARVHIPRRLVDEALRSAPRAITLHSQSDPSTDCLLGVGGGHYARPVTGLNWVLDAAATERRPVTEEDVKRWVRVTHALPNIQLASSAFDQDGAPQSMEVRALGIMLQHTDKPLMVSGLSGEGMRWTSRLCEVCQGAGRHPRVAVLSSVNSPLVYGYGQAEVAMVAAELGIPVLFNSSAVSGVTAPVTLAGSLAQMNAEMLAALVIIQLTRPGAMAVYSGYPVVMDMRTGLAAFGLAEVGLLAAACIEIGRYYGLPTSSNGLTTDTCSLDAMASIEKWNSGYLPALAGANLNGGAGALASQSTISLEQLVIDDDIFGGIFRQMRGIEVNDATLAGELIHKVGPRGSFLASDHTREHYRGEYWYSPLASRVSAAVWEAAGSESVLERARDRVSAILAVPEEPLLTEEQTTDVCALVQEAERALSSLEPHV